MKKKYCISWLLTGATAMFLISQTAASAADRVVVIPLFSGTPTVISAGQVWMDRNLGALHVATKSADPDAYGSLYQWGRLTDGHEYRASGTTNITSSDNVPGHGDFITSDSGSDYDWRYPQKDNLWQGVSGINNPCPAGFRLPTATELNAERASWASNNAAGAFASPLKLVVAGIRNPSNGIYHAGSRGLYWSSTVSDGKARYLYFLSGTADMYSYFRAGGMSVRCFKD